ncbi:MAG: hypothetical protein RJA57_180 [Bacteroidota bacterium]|jgi:hypothetical protein
MKTNRTRKVVNFIAFNMLFFALYLNFMTRQEPEMKTYAIQVVDSMKKVTASNP